MFHEDILQMSYYKYIEASFFLSNIHCQELHLDKLEDGFLNSVIFLHLDSRFSNSYISAKYCQHLTNHTSMESLFIQLVYNV